MKIRRWLIGVGVVLVALGGHIWHSYWPRLRQASPSADSPTAALLSRTDYPAAVWVPYPHQNLAILRDDMGAEPASLKALARLAGLPSPNLPTFGPLTLPPSSEIAVASDDVGERFEVHAQVYPLFAAFAKLAGALASNPWLGGGEISVEGQTADVAWRGSLWTVTSAAAQASGAPLEEPVDGTRDAGDSGLAWIRIRQPLDPLPAGLYRIRQDDSAIGISSRRGPGAATLDDDLDFAHRLGPLGLFLLVFSGRQEAFGEPSRALVFFDQSEEGAMELPRIASLHEPGANRWSLPGESLLDLAGREPRTATSGAWAIAALDSTSLEEAGRAALELGALDGPMGERLSWGLWLDLRGGLAEVERIAHLLGEVPIVPRRQVERWSDAQRVLTPLAARYSHLSAVVVDDPRVFDLRLETRGEPSEPSEE